MKVTDRNKSQSEWILDWVLDENKNLIKAYESFNHFHIIDFKVLQVYEIQKYLKIMKQNRAHFQIIEFRVFSTEDLENYTNPEFYKGGVDSLYLYFNGMIPMTEVARLNLKTIKPKNISMIVS